MEYLLNDNTCDRLYTSGRVLYKNDILYLGYTNSFVSMHTDAGKLEVILVTETDEPVNDPSIRVYADDREYISDFTLSGQGHALYREEYGDSAKGGVGKAEIKAGISTDRGDWGAPVMTPGKNLVYFRLSIETDGTPHTITILKQTEAAMSYVGIVKIISDGELKPTNEWAKPDERTKVEFIGDSITCGYGIHSKLPEDNYTLWDEDGEACYAAVMAREMNWDAQWISASGYGEYISYDGNLADNVPKLYPYVNWFLDKEIKVNPKEFEPDFIFVNLGTNDSAFLPDPNMRGKFKQSYLDFIKLLKGYHPEAKIICVLGTLCEDVFPYVNEVVQLASSQGYDGVYACELPFHDVGRDGVADGHPTAVTHRKDAKRILDFMRSKKIIS